MKSTKQQIVVLMGLLVVMVVVYGRAWRPTASQEPQLEDPARHPSATSPFPVDSPLAARPPTPRRPVRSSQREAQRKRAERLAWDRDPFHRAGKAYLADVLKLSGILWDVNTPMAIINGHLLQVGEELDGFRITAITEDGVLVTNGAESYRLVTTP